MDFQNIINRALTIRKLYEEKEKQLYGSPWTSEEIVLGFVGDVGDLAKLVVAENGKRNIENSHEKLGHELSDCLWSVIIMAKMNNIDLEQSFLDTMDKLENLLLESRE
ncbi:MAG TPA: MazG nucleotide pyrophosphohydrolase domain-containing protein [Anaerolineales bacterium]|nr:MazG nucleotide pyrophosphohydrolase domain-containing protein [Anaerolineales bacterium]